MYLNYLYLGVLLLIFVVSVFMRMTNPLLQLQLQEAVAGVILDEGLIIVVILYLHHRAVWTRAMQDKSFDKNRSEFKAFIAEENAKIRAQLFSFYQEYKRSVDTHRSMTQEEKDKIKEERRGNE